MWRILTSRCTEKLLKSLCAAFYLIHQQRPLIELTVRLISWSIFIKDSSNFPMYNALIFSQMVIAVWEYTESTVAFLLS